MYDICLIYIYKIFFHARTYTHTYIYYIYICISHIINISINILDLQSITDRQAKPWR